MDYGSSMDMKVEGENPGVREFEQACLSIGVG